MDEGRDLSKYGITAYNANSSLEARESEVKGAALMDLSAKITVGQDYVE
jgi:hypothetical protein